MLPKHVALVSLSKKLTASDLSQTAAALQKQTTRDLGPIWGVEATVDYFPDLKSIPLGYWPIIIAENIHEPGAAGFHTDKHHQPYSLVELDDTWQLTCSHEMCEMLVDPYGNKLQSAGSQSLKLGKVNFLVEVCDPCEDASFAYSVNGILVSDFYTPNFFDPQAVAGVRYSFTGSITQPCQVLKNGYISWQDPVTKKWYQATFFGGSKPVIKPIQGMQDFGTSLRSQIDRLTKNPNRNKAFDAKAKKHAPLQQEIFETAKSKSEDWEKEIRKYFAKKQIRKGKRQLTGDAAIATAVITVGFNNGVGSLKAVLNRQDGTSDTLDFDSSGGTQTFNNVFAGDNIVMNIVAAGDVDITIDRDTSPATPINLSGRTNRLFTINS
ncbi:MAG TPA: hypothetical protein VKT28_10565 [Puia sp.]|nr:hypothetical protein [Puia sp.]